jgi:hypothetical protein
MLSLTQKIKLSLIPALLIAASIFVFVPFTIFRGNFNEFSVSLIPILSYFALPMCALFLLFFLISLLLPEKWHQRYIAILIGVGILIWLQGNFLVWDYGVLDGTNIDWTKYPWQGWVDACIWALLLGLAIIKYKSFYRFAAAAALFLISLQCATLIVTSIQQPQIWKEPPSAPSGPPEEIFEFSSNQNIVHILLDQFGTTLFEKIINEMDEYSNDLEGFTFFKEAVTSSSVTYLSVPSFLSGQVYVNDRPTMEFHRQNYVGKNIQTLLASEHSFEIDVATHNWFNVQRESDAHYFEIPTPYSFGAAHSKSKIEAAFMFDIVLFRVLPHYLKRHIYNRQSWLFSSSVLDDESDQYEHFSAKEFIKDFVARSSVGRSGPVYKFIHINSPHPPLVVGSNCEYAGEVLPISEDNFINQAKCIFQSVIQFLDKMKSLNVYDSSLIILQADHGTGIPFKIKTANGTFISSQESRLHIRDGFLPLLLIKPPNSKGTLKTSAVQAELTDIPATISSLLNIRNSFPGRSLYELNPDIDRVRRAYYSSTTHRNDAAVSGYFELLHEYIIRGSVFNLESWKKGQLIEKRPAEYLWGTVLQFGENGNVLHYLKKGWSLPREDYVWNNGNRASIALPISPAEAETIELRAVVRPFVFPEKQLEEQRVKIFVNDSKVGEWRLNQAKKGTSSLKFPSEVLSDSAEMVVTFEFPDAAIPREMDINADKRRLGAAFYSISFTDIDPNIP